MRRSLVSLGLLLLIFLGLWVLPGEMEVWLGLALLVIVFPVILEVAGWVLVQLLYPGASGPGLLPVLTQTFLQSVLVLTFLLYQAWLVLTRSSRHCIGLWSGKNLLEWVTAAD